MSNRLLASAAVALMVTGCADETTTNDPVRYLDDLKDCVVGSKNAPLPLPLMGGAIAIAEIKGWEGETCVVETTVYMAGKPETTTTMSYCEYTPATIALMTDEVAYEQARTGKISFSTESERDMTLSTAMEAECELNLKWFLELNPER